MGRPGRGWLAGCLLLLVPSLAPAADEIVIGMSAAFVGPSRGLGCELYRGAMAWFMEVNIQGGVHGKKIVLLAYDDGYQPEPAITNTRRLILQDRALLLFGYVGTPTVTRVLPLLKLHQKHSVYLFCPFTGAEPMRQGPYADHVFNLRASYRDETAGLVERFVKIGRKRIAVFYQIDAYGRSGWDGVRRALAGHGLKICGEATYRRGTGFRDRMTRQVEIIQESRPDAVICVGAYAACAGFIRDARDAGLDVPIANLSFVGSENMLELLLSAGKERGVDYSRDLINSQVVPSYLQTDLPAVKLYRQLMDRHRPRLPRHLAEPSYRPLAHSFTGLEGFLDARLVVEVLKKLGPDLDRRQLARAAESLVDVDLGLPKRITFGTGKRQVASPVYFTVVEKSQFVSLTDWSRWRK